MADEPSTNSTPRVARLLTGVGGRALSLTLRPLSSAATSAIDASIDLERVALERLLDSPRFERLISTTLGGERLHAAILETLKSDRAKQFLDDFFDSGLFDEFVSRLLASEALWELIDRIADSPAVTAAITQQSLGFADQVGEEVRTRSRRADDWLERTARRLTRRRPDEPPPSDEALNPSPS